MNPTMKLKFQKRQLINRSVLLTAFLFTSFMLSAQEVYDLKRCIRTGLERNFSLKVVRNSEQIVMNDYTRGNAGMLPSVTGAGSFGGALDNTSQHFRNAEEVTSTGEHNTNGSASLNLDMTIFDGFQVQHTFQKLGVQSEIGGLNTQLAVENLIAGIIVEYYYYIEQQSLNSNLAYAVSLSRERVRIDEQRYLLGSASKLELLQSLVYLNADSSRYARQREELRSSKIRLSEMLALEDLGEGIQLKDTLIVINENLFYEELLTQTLEKNTSLQMALKNVALSELDLKIIESGIYPYLSFNAGFGYSVNGYSEGELRSRQNIGPSYGVTLGWTIFDGYELRRNRRNARVEIESRDIRYQEVEQQVKADLLTIYYAYQNNLSLLRLEEQNLEVARENLEIALERYKLGSLAGLELREVQKSLLDAEERLISVKYETKLAEISLLQISGKIMDYL